MRRITKLKFGIRMDCVMESEYLILRTILTSTSDLSMFIVNTEKQTGMICLHREDIVLVEPENPYRQLELNLDDVG